MSEPERLTLRTGAGAFEALAVGDPEAPVVLCFHGFPDHPPSFVPMARLLAPRGYRVIVPWLRGYHPNRLPGPYTPERLARDVVELSAATSPDAPVYVVGHDWGAVATYAAIALAPDRFHRAVTMSVPHVTAFAQNLPRFPSQLGRSWYMAFFLLPRVPERALERSRLIERLWRRWSPQLDLSSVDLEGVCRSIELGLPAPLEYYRSMFRPLGAGIARVFGAERPERRISVPTLWMHGREDGCISPELAAGQVQYFAREVEELVLEGVGHFLALEDPWRVSAAIHEWFGRPSHRVARAG